MIVTEEIISIELTEVQYNVISTKNYELKYFTGDLTFRYDNIWYMYVSKV